MSNRGDFVVRPDLPVGSPERAALFARFRETFVEDWEAARIAVEADRRKAKGGLYFIRAGDCVKIGRTVNLVARLSSMKADNHEELDCLLFLSGRGHEEPEWHRRFNRYRVRGEWFRWVPEIEDAIAEEIADRVL